MSRCGWFGVVAVGWALVIPQVGQAQDTPAAKATRERIKKTVIDEVEWKDVMTREIFNDIRREASDKVTFYIDNPSGMSNNSRMTYKAKKVTIEKILNDLADKNDFGWYVVSDKKDRKDGFIVLRKSKYKERGYFEGKEPGKAGALLETEPSRTIGASIERIPLPVRPIPPVRLVGLIRVE